MKVIFFLALLYCALSDISYVNSFIGTGGQAFGCGALNPGPQRPFGMVRIGPDTINDVNNFVPWEHFGGYHYNDTYIRCFSHTHMVGAGVLDFGNLGVMAAARLPSPTILRNYGYKSNFSHAREEAKPHFYNVNLDTWNIFAELTSTKYVGVHRYTFRERNQPKVVYFYVSHALSQKDGCKGSEVFINPQTQEITGYMINFGGLSRRFGGAKIYFYATFRGRFRDSGVWNGVTHYPNVRTINGTDIGAYFVFDDEKIELNFAISFQSIEQAKHNFVYEVGSKNFDQVKRESEIIWSRELSQIKVESKNHDDKVKFYSALYHSLTTPTTFSEANGMYLGFDNKIHKLDQGSNGYYTELSLWDTFRTQVPFLTVFKPDVQRDIVRSLVNMYEQGGYLPRWPLANGYTSTMIGQHADILIADAYFKGIRDFNVRKAYEGMRKGATEHQRHAGRHGLDSYIKKGYISNDANRRGCSLTVEFAYDDWSISEMAKDLGLNDDYLLFKNRSKNYKNHFDPVEKFCCSREANGKFDCPIFKTNVFDERYIEGDAWHWRFFAPHDTEGLIELFGSKQAFVKELDEFFMKSRDFSFFNALPNPYYWHGNEHNLFYVYLFNWAGRSDLTQKHSRWILDARYSVKSDGLDGNDDYGTVSAWYLFSSMSFYPLSGSSLYVIGSPLFDRVEWTHSKGKLEIISHNNSKENVYIQKSTINGKEFSNFLDHKELFGGNVKIEHWMTNIPNPK